MLQNLKPFKMLSFLKQSHTRIKIFKNVKLKIVFHLNHICVTDLIFTFEQNFILLKLSFIANFINWVNLLLSNNE